MEKKCIGIDVGGTTVKIGLFETDGTLVYKWEVPSRKEENGAYILPDVAASIRKKLNERGIPMDAVIGAGMGFPGPVQPDGYVEVCVNLGWRDLNPQKILSELLDGMAAWYTIRRSLQDATDWAARSVISISVRARKKPATAADTAVWNR